MKNNCTLKGILGMLVLLTLLLSACKDKNNNNVAPGAITLSCNDINVDATWEDRGTGIDYVLNCAITVNAKLTIKPGVTIQCRNGAGIVVETGGTLVAVGTAANPIVLAGDVDVEGIWKGIYIRSASILNEISYSTISNAGNSSFDGNSDKMANIRVNLNAKLKLTNSTVSKSLKDGLLVDGLDSDDGCPITSFAGNTFSENRNFPVSALASIGNVLDGTGSTYTGNTNNKVLLRGGNLLGTHVWKKMNVPYLIDGIASVGYYSSNGNLTVQPGAVVHFANDAGLGIGEYATGSYLNFTGTVSERITLTGESAVNGAWKGISYKSTSPNNKVSYVDISYGGLSSYSGAAAQRGNIIAGSGGQAGSFTIDNSTVNYSGAYGIYATGSSPVITIPSSVTFTGNSSGTYLHE